MHNHDYGWHAHDVRRPRRQEVKARARDESGCSGPVQMEISGIIMLRFKLEKWSEVPPPP